MFGGAKKMSANYKVLQTAMPKLWTSMSAAEGTRVRDFTADRQTALEQQLDKVITTGDAYKAQHAGKAQKTGAIDPVIASATQYKQALDAVMKDPALDTLPANFTLEQAFELKRRGIAFADCKFDTYRDDRRDADRSKDASGSGAVNTVDKIVYADGKEYYFKPEQASDDHQVDASKTIGVDPAAPHYGNRNIASRAVCDLLGANVIPEARYTIHNDKIGLLMDGGSGKSPAQKVFQKVDTDNDFHFNRLKNDPAKLKSLGYEKNEAGEWQQLKATPLVKPWPTDPTPAAMASLHQQLNALEWCDVLSGQIDRHAFNYLVEIRGDKAVVTGIDNDFAFGEKETVPACEIYPRPGFTGVDMPKLIDIGTYTKLTQSDFDKNLKPRLAGLLSAKEIEASRARFESVKKAATVLKEKNCVVEDWTTWKSPDGETATTFLSDTKTIDFVNNKLTFGGHEKSGLFGRDLAAFVPKPSQQAS
jgi:hypothetical protein